MAGIMNRKPIFTDLIVPALACILTAIGLFFAVDAGYARSMHGGHGAIPPEFYSQVEGWILGLIGAFFISKLNSAQLKRAAIPFWGLVYVLLLLTAFSPLHIIKSGAARWIHFGPIVIQPAELAKIGAVLMMAHWFSNRKSFAVQKKRFKDVWQRMDHEIWPRIMRWAPIILFLPAILLIEKEPDMGTAFVIVCICFGVAIFGGARWKSIAFAGLVTVLAVAVFIRMQPYRMERISNHGSQWSDVNIDGPGFQQLQARVSMAYGGLLGVGIGNGRAKHVIPAPTTDFMMATISEETGFIGSMFVLFLLGALCLRLGMLSQETDDKFAALVLIGLAAWLAVQGSVNVLQANDTLPAIGIPFPFISSGGSSLTALWLAVGCAQAALRPAPKKLKEAVVDDRVHRRGDGGTHLPRTGNSTGRERVRG